jgi:hypothetical protein
MEFGTASPRLSLVQLRHQIQLRQSHHICVCHPMAHVSSPLSQQMLGLTDIQRTRVFPSEIGSSKFGWGMYRRTCPTSNGKVSGNVIAEVCTTLLTWRGKVLSSLDVRDATFSSDSISVGLLSPFCEIVGGLSSLMFGAVSSTGNSSCASRTNASSIDRDCFSGMGGCLPASSSESLIGSADF